MSEHPPEPPRKLADEGDAVLIDWRDGVSHSIPWVVLRELCPCATCRDKASRPQPEPKAGAATLLPILGDAPTGPIRPAKMQPLGNYAYEIHFSDGHNTGVYTLDFLYRLGEEVVRARNEAE